MRCSTAWLFQLLQFTTLVLADPGNWTKPDSEAPSFTDTYVLNERIFLSWLSLNDSISDLWLTRFNATVGSFSLRLQVARNISIPGNYEWTIAVSADEVAKDTRFIVQFLPTGAAYDPLALPQIPSPGFNLITLNQQTLPNGTIGEPSIIPSTSAIPAATSSVVSVSNSASALPPPTTGGGSSFGRSAVIGVTVAALLLVLGTIVGAFLVIRAYKRPKPDKSPDGKKVIGPYEVLGTSRQPTELSSKETMVNELSSPTDSLATEKGAFAVFELSTTTKKPGLHELSG